MTNASFGDDLLPVRADVPDLDIITVDRPDYVASPALGVQAVARSAMSEAPRPSQRGVQRHRRSCTGLAHFAQEAADKALKEGVAARPSCPLDCHCAARLRDCTGRWEWTFLAGGQPPPPPPPWFPPWLVLSYGPER